MKILTGKRIKEADRYTIENEPINSINLMERASKVIAQWIYRHTKKEYPLFFLIGKGNNGGDGLAVARMLQNIGYDCSYYCPFNPQSLSEECKINLKRLPKEVKQIKIGDIDKKAIIIDALLGTGIKGTVEESLAGVITQINNLPNKVISIDIPSGMQTEFNNADAVIIEADITLTLEFPKLSMLLPGTGNYCGEIEVLPIGLSREYIKEASSRYYYITESYIRSILKKRDKFDHKGTYGHALLVCGSRGMAGAAVLATSAALRSGCGLVTTHIPENERYAINTACPSAITSLDIDDYFSEPPINMDQYSAVGVGCGLGQEVTTVEALRSLLNKTKRPVVMDADALNIMASHYKIRQYVPKNSILTPHPGELKRLIGEWDDEQQKLELISRLSHNLKSIIIVKGAHTLIHHPNGICFFNPTGNSGMAKGGSGDILTGYITGLLARGYPSLHAAILGVYMHGLAGDKAAAKYGLESMNSQDIVNEL
jgi:NAD(P)H-hydrate epimerase